jgi:hypothetical protein
MFGFARAAGGRCNTESTVLIWLAIILANGVGVYPMFSPQAAYFAEIFDTRVRYSGLAIAREYPRRSSPRFFSHARAATGRSPHTRSC